MLLVVLLAAVPVRVVDVPPLVPVPVVPVAVVPPAAFAPPPVPYEAESALLVLPATAPAVSVPPAFLLLLQPIIPAAPNAIAIAAADFILVIPVASSCCSVLPMLRGGSYAGGVP